MTLRISVFGLGYVGSVSLAAWASAGHDLIGVDPNTTKVDMVNRGINPVIEDGVDRLLAEGVAGGRIRATTDANEAIASTDLSFICVGTPSNPNGSLDLTHIEKVCHEIGTALATKQQWHTLVVRSTTLPGTTEDVVIPTLQAASGLVVGSDFGVGYNPEFLREGSSLRDFYAPPFTLIGATDQRSIEVLKDLYHVIEAELIIAPIKVAEMVKYTSNAYHALKVGFANEVGAVARQLGIDSHQLMTIFAKDTKLNISAAYLKPGLSFGGSCLPKDIRALVYQAREVDVATPMLASILESNQRHLDRAFEMIRTAGSKRVGVLGFSFKAGTDDLRESPVVELIERLIGKGYQVRVYDRNVSLASLQGANRAYIEKEIPHIASLMATSIEDVVASCDVLVVGNRSPDFAESLQKTSKVVIDLVRVFEEPPDSGTYQGICW